MAEEKRIQDSLFLQWMAQEWAIKNKYKTNRKKIIIFKNKIN